MQCPAIAIERNSYRPSRGKHPVHLDFIARKDGSHDTKLVRHVQHEQGCSADFIPGRIIRIKSILNLSDSRTRVVDTVGKGIISLIQFIHQQRTKFGDPHERSVECQTGDSLINIEYPVKQGSCSPYRPQDFLTILIDGAYV